ncbi:hypothetical protein ACHAQA_008692 [Verticillium albo-atrum]
MASKVMTSSLSFEDTIITTAVVMVNLGFGKHLWDLEDGHLLKTLRLFYIAEVVYIVVLALTKASIISMYIHIFRSSDAFRRWSYAVLSLLILSTVIITPLTIVSCRPIQFFWNKDIKGGTCLDVNALAYAHSGAAIIFDVIIITMPIRMLWRLNMAIRRKIQIGVMFAIGGFGLIATVLRLQSLLVFGKSLDPTVDYVPVVYWTTGELAAGIVCSCLPAIRKLLEKPAGGNLGTPVLRTFLDAPSYKVSVLARIESTSVFPEGVKVFKADYANLLEVQLAMQGQDVVISMVTGIAASDQNVFVDAAIAAGVQRFIPSEFGPPSRDAKFAALNHLALPPKAATVDYLRTKESQISWTSLVTGAFFDWALKGGFFGFDLATRNAGLIDAGTTVFTASTLRYIAKAVLAVLEHAGDTRNQYVYIGEFHVSQQDVLKVFERVQAQKWTIEHLTSDSVIENGRKKLAEGDYTGVMDLTRGGAFGQHGLGDNRPWGLWDDKLGLEKGDIERAVRDVL